MADDNAEDGEWTERGGRVRYYRFRNKLRDKAGGGARQEGLLDEQALKRAESTFKKAAQQYPKLVESSITTLADACAQALEKPADQRGGDSASISLIDVAIL